MRHCALMKRAIMSDSGRGSSMLRPARIFVERKRTGIDASDSSSDRWLPARAVYDIGYLALEQSSPPGESPTSD